MVVAVASTHPYAWTGSHLDQQWHYEKSPAALPARKGKYQVHVPVFESDVVKDDELCRVTHDNIMCNRENSQQGEWLLLTQCPYPWNENERKEKEIKKLLIYTSGWSLDLIVLLLLE